jgi:hypothetical protein
MLALMRWFACGFVVGAGLFPFMEWFRVGDHLSWLAAPAGWLILVNPATWLICDVLQRDELCIGLGFDSGPLEWLEYSWLYLAFGLLYGALALGLRSAVGLVRGAFGLGR